MLTASWGNSILLGLGGLLLLGRRPDQALLLGNKARPGRVISGSGRLANYDIGPLHAWRPAAALTGPAGRGPMYLLIKCSQNLWPSAHASQIRVNLLASQISFDVEDRCLAERGVPKACRQPSLTIVYDVWARVPPRGSACLVCCYC